MRPDEAARVGAEFAAIVAAARAFACLRNVDVRRDGTHVVLETSGVPILDEAGALVGYRGIDRAITDRLSAEARGGAPTG